MTRKQTGGPAFPWCGDLNDCPTINLGMTLREYAAIKLRVPDSGAEWLDDMIKQAMRDDFAGQALAGMLPNPIAGEADKDLLAEQAYSYADAMLEERDNG